jgi:hypothetical protein
MADKPQRHNVHVGDRVFQLCTGWNQQERAPIITFLEFIVEGLDEKGMWARNVVNTRSVSYFSWRGGEHAYTTKNEALDKFIARKEARIRALSTEMNNCEKFIRQAKYLKE